MEPVPREARAEIVVEIDHLMRTHGGVEISESGGHASPGVAVSGAASLADPDDDPPEEDEPPDDDPPDDEPPDEDVDDDVVFSSSPHAAVRAVDVSDTPARTTAE